MNINDGFGMYLLVGFIISLVFSFLFIYKQYLNDKREEVITESLGLVILIVIFTTLAYPAIFIFCGIYLLLLLLKFLAKTIYNISHRK